MDEKVGVNKPTLHPDPQAAAVFFGRNVPGKSVMLNLLRFRETADYSADPTLAPQTPISGREAYQKYMKHTAPIIEACGGRVLFAGDGGTFLIGPSDESWDLVLLVEHRSRADFLSFAKDETYLAGLGHRTAALADSRLLPMTECALSV